MVFVGIDWAERHHDVCVLDRGGGVLARRRVPDGVQGVGRLHAMVAELAGEPSEVMVGIETDRGLLVGWLVAAGYRVYATNPFAVSRYRDRHATSGAKSDPGDAKVLADLVRTDRHNHREVAGGSELAEAVKVLARAHQSLVWTRQRQVNQLRSTLREFYLGRWLRSGTTLRRTGPAASWGWRRPRTGDASSPGPGSGARWPLLAAPATSIGGPSSSTGPCTLPSWRLRRSSPRPTGRWSARWWW